MREQVIASRPSRRGGVVAKDFNQRPARRGRGSSEPRGFSLPAVLNYVPIALRVALVVLAVVAITIGYRVASSAALFQVRAVDITGTSRTSAEEIEALVRKSVVRTGVWRADLAALSAEIGRLPGVRRAVVTRVLPDRLRVRVTERVPAAVVRKLTGHFGWVDAEAVSLGRIKSTGQMAPFLLPRWKQ